jgi:hypothetical protein
MFWFNNLNKFTVSAIVCSSLMSLAAAETSGQQAEFERRAEAMRRARSRQAALAHSSAQPEAIPAAHAEEVVPRQRKRVAATRSKTQASGRPTRIAQAQTIRPVRYTQNLAPGSVIDGGVIGESVIGGGYVGDVVIDGGYIEEGAVDSGYDAGVHFEDGCGCDSCGQSGAYFEDGCGAGSCCGRGGCAPGDCWLAGLGGILRNGEYFFGGTGFQEPLYTSPTSTDGSQQIQDSNFGFYGGFNFSSPLCRLTCGILSGQIGLRSVQTNFSGNEFTNESRDQLFVTGGLYRRVDYGFQFGVVGDFLQDEFYGDVGVSQIRADLGWVYAGGSTMGFRYTGGQEDDVSAGTFAGDDFTDQNVRVHDQYRFYYRSSGPTGGYGELFAGWTEDNQTILGLDFDIPVTDRIAVESNLTYFFNDDAASSAFPNTTFLGSNADEAWNISVGFVYRPQGRGYYKNYDRPLFDVADNGTMLLRRSN